MTPQVQGVKRLVERRMDIGPQAQPVRMDELIDRLQREISLARRDDPTLADYCLHDVKLSFQNQAIVLQIDFRK